MSQFVIQGGKPLSGTVTPIGNKNAALPCIAAALLTEDPVELDNVPDIADVQVMLQIAEALGVRVTRRGAVGLDSRGQGHCHAAGAG